MMTSLQQETSSPSALENPQQAAKVPEEDQRAASTTPTRIPHRAVAPFQRSASMRLRGNPSEVARRVEYSPAGGGGFSSRAKLTAIPSSTLNPRSQSVYLKRNRSWSNLGHKTEQEPEVDNALCSAATHCLSLAEELDAPSPVNKMANGKPRNLVSCGCLVLLIFACCC